MKNTTHNAPLDRCYVGLGYWSDAHGVLWVFNSQRGWVECFEGRAARHARLNALAKRLRLASFTFEGRRFPVSLV